MKNNFQVQKIEKLFFNLAHKKRGCALLFSGPLVLSSCFPEVSLGVSVFKAVLWQLNHRFHSHSDAFYSPNGTQTPPEKLIHCALGFVLKTIQFRIPIGEKVQRANGSSVWFQIQVLSIVNWGKSPSLFGNIFLDTHSGNNYFRRVKMADASIGWSQRM